MPLYPSLPSSAMALLKQRPRCTWPCHTNLDRNPNRKAHAAKAKADRAHVKEEAAKKKAQVRIRASYYFMIPTISRLLYDPNTIMIIV